MLGLFVNTLTGDEKYSRHNRENFPPQIEMIFCRNPKPFCTFYIPFMTSTSNFEYFEKKSESHSLSVSEIIDFEGGQ